MLTKEEFFQFLNDKGVCYVIPVQSDELLILFKDNEELRITYDDFKKFNGLE